MRLQATDEIGAATQAFQIHVSDGTPEGSPFVETFVSQPFAVSVDSRDAEIFVTFSEPVDASPLDVIVLNEVWAAIPLSGFGYESTTQMLTLTADALNFDEIYSIVLFLTITDFAGNPLDGNGDGTVTFPPV